MFQENQTDLAHFCQWSGVAGRPAQALAQYIELLEKWSQRTNLISLHDQRRIVRRHITDSFAFCQATVIPPGAAVLDLGSGAGLPGIPLAIIREDLQITLLDSKRMRALFLREVVEQLGLLNVRVLNERVEALARQRSFNVVTARAVASVEQLWEWSKELLLPGGRMVTQKGRGEMLPVDPSLQISEWTMDHSESNSVILIVQEGGSGDGQSI
jgi:16S rRNA (guanine527-N7)-methyltransferase